MRRVVVFDVIETLLDPAALDARFSALFGGDSGTAARRLWFARLLHASTVTTLLGGWTPFGDLARAVLTSQLEADGVTADAEQIAATVAKVGSLPAHGDAAPALQRLREAGFTVATLTNSTASVAEAQLRAAGLRDHVDVVLSVEAVRRYKPDPAVYHHAAQTLGVAPDALRLVAAHDWDCAGALAAGCAAAYVGRPGGAYRPGLAHPDLVADDLVGLADAIIAADADP